MNGLLKPCYDRIKAIYAAHIGFERNRTVLDLGCGSRGNFLNIAGGDYTGIDSNPKIISALSRRGNGRYLVMDAGKLEFGPGCFDVIVSTSLFHHLNDRDCRKVCAQMRTVLKHDGRIIVADGVYPRSWLNIAGRILRFLRPGAGTCGTGGGCA
jgi:Methylase involved in ubiquinone/menaquinone biosynthesis